MDNVQNFAENAENVKNKRTLSEKNKKLIFYIIMFAPLILQVAIFYIYVNISNIGLAFSKYDFIDGVGNVSSFAGFDNFSFVLNKLFSSSLIGMFRDTFIMYAVLLCVAMPIGMFFSFYIYKKFMFSEFFRVILFLPQVLSAVAMTTIYKTLTNDLVMMYTGVDGGLLGGYGSVVTMITIIFYTLWMGFGANILLYCGAMSGINDSIIEACHLDGCNVIKEFFYVILPSIYPTITTFILIDIAGIFTNQMNLHTFYGQKPLPEGINGTIGYYLVKQTQHSDFVYLENGPWSYSQLSALGVLITVVTVPVSLIVRTLMEKFGPSED